MHMYLSLKIFTNYGELQKLINTKIDLRSSKLHLEGLETRN